MNNNKTLSKNPFSQAAALSLLAFAFVLFTGDSAFATPVGGSMFNLCTIINTLFYNSSLGKGIATLGVIGIGISATFGKVTWGMAVIVAVGIAAIFGAGTLAASAGGGC